jgi:hypothetical protein
MFYGEFRKEFLGDEDADKNPEYHFLIDPGLESSRQGLIMAAQQQQQAQAQAGAPQQQPAKPSLQDVYNSKTALQKSYLEDWLSITAKDSD